MRGRRVPWLVYGLSLVVLAVAAGMWINLGRASTITPHPLLVPGYGFVGALIASRTNNRMGWLFLGYALFAASFSFLVQLTEAVELNTGSVDIGGALWPATYLFFGLVLLLFPTGRPAGRFWKAVLWVLLLSWGTLILTPLIGIEIEEKIPPLILVSIASLLACVPAPLFRRRRAGAQEREQLRWLAYAIVTGLTALAAGAVIGSIVPALGEIGALIALVAATLGIPAAVGMAIVRNRLYDIDVVINRTLVYASLTATLAGSYLLTVIVLQTLLESFVSGSELAVAGSTLIVAALFRPARDRVQGAIDRRFYRSRYDARETVAAFSSKLREHVDLSVVTRDMMDVVNLTMRPEYVSLWLRGEGPLGPS